MNPPPEKRVKAAARSAFPRLYDLLGRTRRLPSTIGQAVERRRELDRYRHCLKAGRPYIGPVMMARQTDPVRQPHMRKAAAAAAAACSDGRIALIEIGSWAGHSAILWAETIKSLGLPGVVVCVDPWMPYDETSAGAVPAGMRDPAEDGGIFRLFLHNVAASGHEDVIRPFRGYSDDVLPLLRPHAFALVYVDGSHARTQVANDLRNSASLVVEGGLLCGDDLERQLHEIDADYARAAGDRDYVEDPRTGDSYHPGVAVAVADFFGGAVSCFDGFWAMRKRGQDWEPVQLA